MSSSFQINEILVCLKNTYSSPDKNIRLQSEQRLSELKDQNIVIFTSKLIDVLKLPSTEIDNSLKLSIILHLKRSIKVKIEKEELDKDSCNQLIQLYISIIVNPILSNKELENLIETFSDLLTETSGEILLEIITYINKEITRMPVGSVNGVISLLLSIILSPSLTRKFFLPGLSGILMISFSIVQNLYNEYEKINLDLEKNHEEFLKFNHMFMNAYDLFFQCNFKSSKRFKIKDENISKIFSNIFVIGAKILVNVKCKDNNRIISWTENENIDKNINNMKIKIFRFLNLQVSDLGPLILEKEKIEIHEQLIKIILSNLEWIIMNKYVYLIKIESTEDKKDYVDYNYQLIISYMFIYLKRIFSKDNFVSDYSTHFIKMYKNILLPLLLITNIELDIALDNECVNGYCIDINDVIYENKEKKIKSTVAGLIKVFYEKNITCNSFIIKYTLYLLEYLINNKNKIQDKTLFDESDIIIILLKAYQKERIICALFLSLNIISEVSSKNHQNDLFLRDFFERTFESINLINNFPCLKHQIILFIRNYSLRFFEPDSNAFGLTINYLFNCLFDQEFSLISNSAADAINYFFSIKNEDSENIKYTLLKSATLNIKYFEEQINKTKISNFFDVLYQILMNFENRGNEFFQKIFENICKRIHVEVERHYRLKFKVKKEKNKVKKKATEKTNFNDYNIIINKTFNIIRMLMHNERFVIDNIELIEKSLGPLIQYMNDPNKIDFDEDIINIIYLIITHNKKVTPLSFTLIKNIYKYIDKVGGILLDSYMLINAYMAYGTEQILSNQEWFLGITNAFNSGIKSTKFRNSAFYTCILIQTWLINCSNIPLNNLGELFNNIIKHIMRIFGNYKNNKSIGDEMYNYLGYVTLILCGLINYSSVIISELKKSKNETSLKHWLELIKKENEPGFEYEIKIIIFSICTIIQKNLIFEDSEVEYLLNICIDLLNCQEMNAKFEFKKNFKKELNLNFIEDDDEDDDQNDGGDDTEEELTDFREIKDLIKNTINPIKNIDEFKTFSALLLFLKNNRSDIYIRWENGLDQIKKNEVTKLFATKRINIQNNKNENVQIPRRIVNIKRHFNNNQ